MAIIKGPLKYNGDYKSLSFSEIKLEFLLPKFRFERENKPVKRVEQQPATKTVPRSLSSTKYKMLYPSELLVGKNRTDLESSWAWILQATAPPFSVDEFRLKIPYSILGPNGVNIGQGCLNALFFVDITAETDSSNKLTYSPQIDLNLTKKLFIINEEAFNLLLKEVFTNKSKDTSISNEFCLLMLISEFGLFSEDSAEQATLTDQHLDHIAAKWQISRPILNTILERFDKLMSFPIELEALSEIKPAGTFWVSTAEGSYPRSDLDYYHIDAEARIQTGAEGSRYRTWRVDWDEVISDDDNREVISNNRILKPLRFKLKIDYPIIASSIEGTILVRVIGFDGTTLWRRTYKPNSDDLENIEIVIDSYLPGRLESGQAKDSVKLRKIRGQVLSSDRSQSVSRLTVVIQAKEVEDSLWRIISGGQTGSSGHFSLRYPKGKFVAAQALVSASPDSAVDLDIVDSGAEDETISDDFLYLLISSKSLPEGATCPSGNISRLPDHADLVGSDEYSQDLGGQCVQITRPNRTLREYSYNAIVRVSDPEVANYTLERATFPSNLVLSIITFGDSSGEPGGNLNKSKREYQRGDFILTGGTQPIERAHISLSNPVRWQDAPGAGNKLSFYQAVSVATGHILFFKAVFKADGYSLGDLVYSLPLAPGQKKQIVSYNVADTLEASETQRLAQGERLAAELVDERIITDELGGGISETLSGQSSARTSGFSAGLGLGVSMGKFGGSLGVAGGYSNARSSASQSGARNISQFFAEKLRQALMQNAESYRELNASVVTTVKEGQDYAVTTEVVANHNHCHSVTMMFFEVLRHYAITQELYDVQECVFVPFLLTEFTQENISKWKDVLATNLLPIPSNTYLQPPWFAKYVKRHPLAGAFDANERIKTNWNRVDYPEGSYAEDSITSISGEIRLRTRLPRPRTRFDRIMSLPVISKTITTEELDKQRMALAWKLGGDKPGLYFKTAEVKEVADISDEVIQLDANFQNVPPAQAIRVMTFKPVTVSYSDGTSSTVDGFDNNPVDKEQWQAYANILGDFTDVYDMMDKFFAGRLVSEWDGIFNQDIAPLVFNKIVDSIKVDAPLNLDLTPTGRYTGGEHSMRLRISGGATSTRADLPTEMRLHSTSDKVHQLRSFATLIVENVRIQYSTAHFNGYIYNGYVGNDLLDEDFVTSGATLSTPLTERDKRNPKKEDEYIVGELFEHLNSNLEHYNKVLWRNLDPDRRYMLLDGFSIETFDRSGHSIDRSLASVVKNDPVAIVGNSLVFPVADGYHVSRTHIAESDEDSQPSLLEHYRPEREIEPYRLSVPTRGVYMESVMGQCDACENVKKNSSQDWSRFGTEEPTAIAPVVTPTPTRTDWRAIWAQFAQPLIAIQTSRETPAPGAGLQGLSETLANAAAFRDVTGLAGNQENVIRTYLSNQENARAFAEMAKTMAMQEHNTENSESIMQSLDNAREQGAISDNDYSELVRDHLGQQIDGGARRQAEERRESTQEPSLTNAAIDAVEQGRNVTAQRTQADGTSESLSVSKGSSKEERPHVSWMAGVPADMAAFKRCIVNKAIEEYVYWHTNGPHVYNAWWENDDDPHVLDRLRAYWEAVRFPRNLSPDEITERINSEVYWSAAFISYIFNQCHISDNRVWPLSGLHYNYIAQSIRNSQEPPNMENPFHGYRVNDYAPEIGDLVGRCSLYDPVSLGEDNINRIITSVREGGPGIQPDQLYRHRFNENYETDEIFRRLRTVIEFDNIENPLSKSSHVDIIVEKRDDHILAIGGNLELESAQMGADRPQPNEVVNRSVGIRRIWLDENGKIDPTCRWEILGFPANEPPIPTTDPWLPWENAEVLCDGPQTEYFVIIKARTDPNV